MKIAIQYLIKEGQVKFRTVQQMPGLLFFYFFSVQDEQTGMSFVKKLRPLCLLKKIS